MSQGVDIGSFVGSNFDGDKAISKIMHNENKKKKPVENYKFLYQMKKEAWEGLQKKLNELNTVSRNFFNPLYTSFKKTVTSSSNKALVEAFSDKIDPKKVKMGQYSIIPKKKAEKTHFRSDPLNIADKIPATKFNITYQNKDYSITFNGGSPQDLADTITKVAGDFLIANITNINTDQAVLDLEGKKIGKKFGFDIQTPSSTLKKIGLIKKASPEYFDIHITNKENLSSNKDLEKLVQNKKLNLLTKDFAKKLISPSKSVEKNSQLWIYLEAVPKKPSKKNPKHNSLLKNQQIKKNSPLDFIDKMWVGDSDLYGGSLLSSFDTSLASKNNKDNSKPSPKASTPYKIEVQTTSQASSLALQQDFDNKQKGLQVIKFALKPGDLTSVSIKNMAPSTVRIVKVEIVNLNIGKLAPKNSISKAQNAIVNYKGIDYERETNDINDIISGLKLHINEASNKKVKVNLQWDFDSVFNDIKNWVITYNNMIDYIKNISTRDRSSIKMGRSLMDEIEKQRKKYDKLSRDEKSEMSKSGELFKGLLASEFTVGTIKRKIQSVITQPYKTDADKKVMFLSQLGIKRPSMSDISTSSSDEEKENYQAGYLDFTKEGQKTFFSKLKEHYLSVKELFFKKEGKTIPFNKGLMVELNKALDQIASPFNGIIKTQVKTLDNKVKAQDKKMSSLDERLAKQEQNLRKEFGNVYKAQIEAKSMQNRLKGFNGNN